jgi:uncharacterized protein (TIGR03437 family)
MTISSWVSRCLAAACAILLVLVVFLTASSPVRADPALVIPEQTVRPDGTAIVRVSLTSTDVSISGVQFEVDFDSAAIDVRSQAPPELATASKSLFSVERGPNSRRVLIAGSNQFRIPDGPIAELIVKARDGVSGSHPLRLRNAIGTDATGNEVPISTRDGSITISSSAPVIEGVRNAASFSAGPVAPGVLVSIFGAGFTEQIQVSVNGTPAPILSILPTQINAVIPYSVEAANSAKVVIVGSAGSATFDVPVAGTAPAIFTVNSSGSGQGAILNQDMAANSAENPARTGSVVAVYATGFGQTDPPSSDGSINESSNARPVLPVTAEIEGREVTVLHAGPAPGLISGVFQINVQVPEGLTSGARSISLSIGGTKTQAGVTVYIR